MKFCIKCGTQLPDGALFCPGCGYSLSGAESDRAAQGFEEAATSCTQADNAGTAAVSPAADRTNLVDAFVRYWKGYADFKGSSSVGDYWYAVLFNLIISAGFVILYMIFNGGLYNSNNSPNTMAYSLVSLLPGLAILVRRLRDGGYEWTRIFMILIPLAGPIILIVDLCKKSVDPETSRVTRAAYDTLTPGETKKSTTLLIAAGILLAVFGAYGSIIVIRYYLHASGATAADIIRSALNLIASAAAAALGVMMILRKERKLLFMASVVYAAATFLRILVMIILGLKAGILYRIFIVLTAGALMALFMFKQVGNTLAKKYWYAPAAVLLVTIALGFIFTPDSFIHFGRYFESNFSMIVQLAGFIIAGLWAKETD